MEGGWCVVAVPGRGILRAWVPDEDGQRQLAEAERQQAAQDRIEAMRWEMARQNPEGHPDAAAILSAPSGVPTRQPGPAGSDPGADFLKRFGGIGGAR